MFPSTGLLGAPTLGVALEADDFLAPVVGSPQPKPTARGEGGAWNGVASDWRLIIISFRSDHPTVITCFERKNAEAESGIGDDRERGQTIERFAPDAIAPRRSLGKRLVRPMRPSSRTVLRRQARAIDALWHSTVRSA